MTDRVTLETVITVLEHYFDLSAEGYVCQTRDMWNLLVEAAARCTYIETVCNDLADAPDSNTVRGYLNEQLIPPIIGNLKRQCNRALASQLPSWLADHPKEVAFDLHDAPYYGKDDDPDDPDCWVCRGEARAGTTRFYRCATAYVMHKDVRFTLAVEFVRPGDNLIKILKRLLRRVKALKIRLKRGYLDKGFCSIPVMRGLLAEPDLSLIMAAPIKGKTGGTRALCQGCRSYRTEHTFRSDDYGELTVPVMVVRTWSKRRDGTHKWAWLIYVLINVPDLTARQVRKAYRRRFGIESSYRLLEQVRGRTTSRNAALRFLWMGIALLIGNIWIALHWTFLRRCGSGPRRVARQAFILPCMLQFLRRAIEAIYGVISVVDPPYVKPANL
ncbi:MAG: transposase [Chloroflexota bacterium]